jgi:hypothetical protein
MIQMPDILIIFGETEDSITLEIKDVNGNPGLEKISQTRENFFLKT